MEMIFKTKDGEGFTDSYIYTNDPKSRFAYFDRKKANVLGCLVSIIFSVDPDHDIPHIPPVE